MNRLHLSCSWLHRASSCLVALLILPSALLADENGTLAMDQAFWSYTGDRFHCKLELPLEKKGQLAFVHNAGADLRLRFEPHRFNPMDVLIAAVPAPWAPEQSSRHQPLSEAEAGFHLSAHPTKALLAQLDNGYWLSLLTDDEELRIPTIRWSKTITPFLDCQSQLSPLSAAQARDQVLFYSMGQRALTEDQLEQLAQLAKYAQLDPRFNRILVDSYTDNTGSRLANLQLSRERAADVAAALQAAGIPESRIEQRAHGERFPSAQNDTQQGRDLSRRVTLRIVRQETEKRI